jgi:dTDP-4-dehydrorhamnose reductase
MVGICGASGYIGYNLYCYLTMLGEEVLGTYCKNEKPGLVKFDLMKDEFSIFANCEYVVIASAYAKIKFCEENPTESFKLNYEATTNLLLYLENRKIDTLFISSDAVEKFPNTKYGRYKALVEDFIKINWLHTRYIRPGKITYDNINRLCEEIYADIKFRRR